MWAKKQILAIFFELILISSSLENTLIQAFKFKITTDRQIVGRHSLNGDPLNDLVDSGDTDAAVSDFDANEAVLTPFAAPRVLDGPVSWSAWCKGAINDYCFADIGWHMAISV